MFVRLKTDGEAYEKGLMLSRQAPSEKGLEDVVWRDKVTDFVVEFFYGDVWQADKAENPENLWEILFDKAENGTLEDTVQALDEVLARLAEILGDEAVKIAEKLDNLPFIYEETAKNTVSGCENGGIYILFNPAFREYSMLVNTHDISSTLESLNRAVPFEYEVFAVYRSNCNDDFHTFLETFLTRIRNTDFYDMPCEKMYKVFKGIAGISGTTHFLDRKQPDTASEPGLSDKSSLSDENTVKSEISASDSSKNKKKPFSFSECGIPVGAVIEFADDLSEKAVVVSDKKVEYKGKTYSLTGLAKELVGTDTSIQGPYYFTYKGTRLTELRNNELRDNE